MPELVTNGKINQIHFKDVSVCTEKEWTSTQMAFFIRFRFYWPWTNECPIIVHYNIPAQLNRLLVLQILPVQQIMKGSLVQANSTSYTVWSINSIIYCKINLITKKHIKTLCSCMYE